MTGSHFDAIPHSGMYDGVLGIFAALEAIRALREAHVTLRRSVGVVAFTSEEPTRFGISCLGSRVMSAALTGAAADACVDKDGISVLQARTAAGYTGDASSARLARGAWASFVELHIEQADILEKTGVDIGAVTAIAAPASMQVVFDGDGGHAGALLMKYRNDALVAAAELITFVEQVAKGASEDSVATVGRVEVFPNAINSVPRRVTMGVDVRDIDEARRNRMVSCIRSKAEAIASRRRVKASFEITNADDPAKCDDRIVKTVVDVAKAAGLSVKTMVSRAYHDALFVARFAKTGMIFVPCRGGVSHAPEEYVEEEDVENGVRVLAGVLRELGEEVVGATEEKEEL